MMVSGEGKARGCLSALLNEAPEVRNRVWVNLSRDVSDDHGHTNPVATSLPWWPDLEGPGP